eukprot:g27063.t1
MTRAERSWFLSCYNLVTGRPDENKTKKNELPEEAKPEDAAKTGTDGALTSILIGVGVTVVFFLGLYCTLQMGRRRSQQQERDRLGPLMGDPQPARPTVRSYRQQRQMQGGAAEPEAATPSATPAPATDTGSTATTGSASRGGYGARRNQSGAATTPPAGQEF